MLDKKTKTNVAYRVMYSDHDEVCFLREMVEARRPVSCGQQFPTHILCLARTAIPSVLVLTLRSVCVRSVTTSVCLTLGVDHRLGVALEY